MNQETKGAAPGSPLLMLVYHFAPSKEIGARRITACAVDLAQHGIPVLALSAFGDEDPAGIPPANGIQKVWVRTRKPWMLKSLVAAKQAISSLWRRRAPVSGQVSESVASVAVGSPKMAVRSSLIARVAMLVDAEKNWSFRAALKGAGIGRHTRPIAVMASGPPMSSVVGAYLVSKLRKIPLIVDLRDPWLTGSKWETEANESMEAKIGRFLEFRAFRRATLICVATHGMAERLRNKYPQWTSKIFVIRNGYDGEPSPAKILTNARLDFLFAGEIYVNRDPFPFLEAVDRLLNRAEVDSSRVGVKIVGRCDESMSNALSSWLRNRKRESNIQILPPVPFKEVARMTADATILLNLAQKASVMVPAKAYEHVASGREILLISEKDTDVYKMFTNVEGVHCVDSGDDAKLDETLADLYSRHVISGRANPPSAISALEFSRNTQQAYFRSLLESHGIVKSVPSGDGRSTY